MSRGKPWLSMLNACATETSTFCVTSTELLQCTTIRDACMLQCTTIRDACMLQCTTIRDACMLQCTTIRDACTPLCQRRLEENRCTFYEPVVLQGSGASCGISHTS
jgi:hypothetical protein